MEAAAWSVVVSGPLSAQRDATKSLPRETEVLSHLPVPPSPFTQGCVAHCCCLADGEPGAAATGGGQKVFACLSGLFYL